MPDLKTSFALTVDVGGTLIKAALVDAQATIFHIVRLPTPAYESDPAKVIAKIVDAAGQASAALPPGSKVVGTAVSTPAFAVGPQWTQLLCSNIPALEGFALRPVLVDSFGSSVCWEYDTHAAFLAELQYGPFQGFERILYIGIGTGISCAMAVDGELVRHTFGTCGNTGHIIVERVNPKSCTCGGSGCLETVTSGWALRAAALEAAKSNASPYLAELLRSKGDLGARDVSVAAQGGDRLARDILDQAGRALGTAIASMMHIYMPDVVVIGGGVSAAGAALLEPAQAVAQAVAAPDSVRRLRAFRRGSMGPDAGVIGLGSLVFGSGRTNGMTAWIDRDEAGRR